MYTIDSMRLIVESINECIKNIPRFSTKHRYIQPSLSMIRDDVDGFDIGYYATLEHHHYYDFDVDVSISFKELYSSVVMSVTVTDDFNQLTSNRHIQKSDFLDEKHVCSMAVQEMLHLRGIYITDKLISKLNNCELDYDE